MNSSWMFLELRFELYEETFNAQACTYATFSYGAPERILPSEEKQAKRLSFFCSSKIVRSVFNAVNCIGIPYVSPDPEIPEPTLQPEYWFFPGTQDWLWSSSKICVSVVD